MDASTMDTLCYTTMWSYCNQIRSVSVVD
uniref:Uncharacterized protein n=1 Tax=Schistosoma japonicum TaxID=6182 RepID=Q5BW81_SCHJA|nr:unknown [Schistosoma japonicum]